MAKYLDYEGIKEFLQKIVTAPTNQDPEYLIGTVDDKLVRYNTNGLTGDLYQDAWGVKIMHNVSSLTTGYERVGNTALYQEYMADCGRWQVSNDGSKKTKLNVNDSTKYADTGEEVDHSKGHIMVRIAKLYYLLEEHEDTNIPILWMSPKPISENYIDESYLGVFFINTTSDNRATSIPGQVPLRSTTIEKYWEYAQNNGEDFGVGSYEQRQWLVMMHLSEFESTDNRTTIGYGVGGSTSNTLYSSHTQGGTMSLGDASGHVDISGQSNSACDTSLAGVENTDHFLWEMVQGVYKGYSGNAEQDGSEIFIYKENKLPSSGERATHPDCEYRILTNTHNGTGYVKTILCGDHFDIFPDETCSSSSEYWASYAYNYIASSNYPLVFFGLASYNGSSVCGLVSSTSNPWTSSDTAYSARLACYKSPETVVSSEM